MRFRETGGRDRVFKRKEKYAFIKNRAFHPILRRVLSLRYVLKIAGTSRRTKKRKKEKEKPGSMQQKWKTTGKAHSGTRHQCKQSEHQEAKAKKCLEQSSRKRILK